MRALLTSTLSRFISEERYNPKSVTDLTCLKAALYIMLLAFFFSPPPIERLTSGFHLNDRFKAFSEQINGTYNSASYSIESHESKLSYRIVPGLIGKLSFSSNPRIQMLFLYLVQVTFGFISILILLKGFYKLTQDWLYSVVVTSGLMLTHLGSSFFYDTSFFLDGYPFFLMILAMFTPYTWLSFALIFISFWCDERVILGGIAIVIFRNYNELNKVSLKNYLLSKNSILFVSIVGIYALIRLWVTYRYAISIPLGNRAGVGFSAIWEQRNHLAIAQLFTFEFCWIYLLPVFIFFYRESKALFFMIFLYLAISIPLTGIVLDVMRSVNYLFPIIILGIVIYSKQESRKEVNNVAFVSTLLNLIIPNYRYFYNFYIVIPLPLKIIELAFASQT